MFVSEAEQNFRQFWYLRRIRVNQWSVRLAHLRMKFPSWAFIRFPRMETFFRSSSISLIPSFVRYPGEVFAHCLLQSPDAIFPLRIVACIFVRHKIDEITLRSDSSDELTALRTPSEMHCSAWKQPKVAVTLPIVEVAVRDKTLIAVYLSRATSQRLRPKFAGCLS